MKFIALSLGINLGVAAGGPGYVIAASQPMSAAAIRAVLDDTYRALVFHKVLINDRPVREPGSVPAYHAAIATVEEWCRVRQAELEPLSVDDVRELWCGNRKATGEQMAAESVRRDLGGDRPASAMALALLHFEFCKSEDGAVTEPMHMLQQPPAHAVVIQL